MVLDRLDVELATTRLDVHNDVHGLGMSTRMYPEHQKRDPLRSLALELLRGASTPKQSFG